MYYKKFEHYMIFSLLKHLTMVLYVSARPTDSDETKIFTNSQLAGLAAGVCSDMEFYLNVSEETCAKSFWAPDPMLPELPSPVRIRCQSSWSIKFQIEPSHNWQLVALVPQLNDNQSDMDYIEYTLVPPDTEFEELSTTPDRNYTLWSAILKEGVPQIWLGGDEVPAYNKSMLPSHRNYSIQYQFYADVGDKFGVNATFTWNTTGDGDACFHVVNICQETGPRDMKVLPNKYNVKPQITFDKLSFNDRCDIQVTGLYGSTTLSYHTPSSTSSHARQLPDIPSDIFLEAREDSAATWQVRVNWSAPAHPPDKYNVTLRTRTIQSIVLPGNVTEAIFKEVAGESNYLYNVSIYASLGNHTAHTSRRALFPGRSSGGAGVVAGAGSAGRGAGGAAVGAACVGAAALALLCRCRRRRTHISVPPYKPDDKPPKDGSAEVLEVWSEAEDQWEVRAERLRLHEVIGEGAFGVVRRATLAPSNLLVAVKMLKDFPSEEEVRSFRSEMELMKSVGAHPHLVSLVGCCSGRRPLIVAEYCSRGDLLSYLRRTWDVMLSKRNAKYYNNNIDTSDYRNDLFKCKPQMENSKLVVNKLYDIQEICDTDLTALDLLSFCRQIAMGMEFLAANRVVHRDLAARNVLVTADRTLKIADFGLSRDVYEENQYKQKGNGKMPVKWMALESLQRRIYTTQSDVWSFGVVVWEIATVGAAPYAGVAGARLPRLLRSGYRMPRPVNCSPLLYDIMLSCWRTAPRERPTFAALHQRLDELLNSACADHYLSLEIDADDAPPTPKHYRYIKMFIRGKRNWGRGENYERPLKAPPPRANHYTSPPDQPM
ncbi:unnamed protein product [Chrysodeixis includens]|uniref:receptor protein-tyrosine kinase n=1 Tax=Chrysodeixis includens TaxID=689277 RepID=A0A9P0BRU4_CHRIL|nr:unnamed protein product [Chrysodeixis includens]